jgi:hypothetical protein
VAAAALPLATAWDILDPHADERKDSGTDLPTHASQGCGDGLLERDAGLRKTDVRMARDSQPLV